MKEVMQAVHDALARRWKKAGSPAHSTEPCLWDLERYLDGLEQQRKPEDVLAEAAQLLEAWIDCGQLATADEAEAEALQAAKEVLAVTA